MTIEENSGTPNKSQDGLPLRFCIGTPTGPASGMWSIFANNDDVYVAVRSIAGKLKISLHASGWRNASTTTQAWNSDLEFVDLRFRTRHASQWRRAVNTGSLVTVPLTLVFPNSELRIQNHRPKLVKKSAWFTPPGDGQSAHVTLLLSSNQAPAATSDEPEVARRELPSGEIQSPIPISTAMAKTSQLRRCWSRGPRLRSSL